MDVQHEHTVTTTTHDTTRNRELGGTSGLVLGVLEADEAGDGVVHIVTADGRLDVLWSTTTAAAAGSAPGDGGGDGIQRKRKKERGIGRASSRRVPSGWVGTVWGITPATAAQPPATTRHDTQCECHPVRGKEAGQGGVPS